MIDRFGHLACTARGTLARPALFLECEVQAFGEAAEGKRRATKGGVLLGQPSKFLATMRTVICHKVRPLRSSRAFEFDDIHTGHNAPSHRTVPAF
jgi:hypothetical protein